MSRRDRFIARARDEQGQALVLAIAIVVIGLLLGLGAVAYGLSVSQQSVHDERGRGAQQAADSGTQQKLYEYSDSDSVGYNLTGGPLGIGTLLSCTVPELTAGVVVGTVQVAANSAGICPSSCTTTTSCTSPTGSAGTWTPVDSEDYYESQFYANSEEQGGNSTGSGDAVQFPEIVSIGCHTTATTAPTASCDDGGAGNDYSRQLAILAPTGPLQSIEATNDVTVNSSLNLLNQLLESQDISCGTVTILLVVKVTECSVNNSDGLLGALAATVQSLVGTVCDTVAILEAGGSRTCVVNELVSTVDSVTSLGVVDGDVSAGNTLYLPNTTVDVNTSTGTLSTLGNIAGSITSLLGTLANPTSLFPTFEYGKQVCSSITTTTCGTPSGSGTTTPITSIAPTYVHSTQACTAGQPSKSPCTLTRPTFGLTTAPTSGATLPTGITYSGSGTASYANGTIKVTGDTAATPGTLNFRGGQSYVLCGIYADQNVSLGVTSGTTGGVQIYIEAPGKNGCSSSDGNFVVCGGIANGLTTGGLNAILTLGATNVVNPSGIQVYVAGSGATVGGATLGSSVGNADTAPGGTCPWSASGSGTYASGLSSADPSTQAYIGDGANGATSGSLTQAFIVYAPRSEVSVNTAAAFEGSAIGWNVDITALAILQDLDIGSYPLSSIVNAYQVEQTVQCDNSIEALSYSESGNPQQNYGSSTVVATGNAGDLDGCTG